MSRWNFDSEIRSPVYNNNVVIKYEERASVLQALDQIGFAHHLLRRNVDVVSRLQLCLPLCDNTFKSVKRPL